MVKAICHVGKLASSNPDAAIWLTGVISKSRIPELSSFVNGILDFKLMGTTVSTVIDGQAFISGNVAGDFFVSLGALCVETLGISVGPLAMFAIGIGATIGIAVGIIALYALCYYIGSEVYKYFSEKKNMAAPCQMA